jgi:hypothetical protein
MSKLNDDAIIEVTGLIIYVVGFPIWLLYEGFVLSYYWSWFVMPYFPVPPLGILPAWGIASMLAYAIVPNTLMVAKGNQASTWVHVSTALVRPTITLVVGWLVSRFL